MLTVCSSNIDLNPASHNYSIDMKELCERPVSQYASITLAYKSGNASVHVVFDGIFFPHSNKTKLCGIICMNFHGDSLDRCM